MRRKQSIIGILLSILMIINIVPIIKVSAASFTPRYSLSYEDTQSKYWASGTYGVSNGFPRNWNSGYSGGNCTWYAFGRAWELLGTLPNLCTNNAGAWYSYNKSHGYYPYGSTPKLGAIEVQTTISNLTQSASCVAAVYDSSGKLLGQTVNDVNSSTNSVTAYFTNYSNASYVKVFLWDSLKGMKPLTNGEKVNL